jgi:hypothetical protein
VSLRTWGVVACAVALVLVATYLVLREGPVTIDAPDLSAADAAACRDFVAQLPDEMAGQDRREVTGDTEYGAAWGDPAIVVTCGVGVPAGFADDSTCVSVNKTGWFVPDEVFDDMFSGDETTDVRSTELNYRPRIEMFLPGRYRPDGFPNTTATLAPLIEKDLRKVGSCQ